MGRPGETSRHGASIFLTLRFHATHKRDKTTLRRINHCDYVKTLFTFFSSSPELEMGVEKVFVAQRVATKLFATENAIDAAMVEAAELMADMLKARKDIGLSAVVGDRASAKLVEALAALSEARSAMVDMHGELNDVKLRIGVRTKMVGIEDKPPETTRGLAEVRSVREAI